MTFHLTHPRHGTVKTDSEHLRDRYLARGFEQVIALEDMDYRELQALARDRGIPANRSRDALLEALR